MLRLLTGAVLAWSATLGLAGEAGVLHVTRSVEINAPAADVWNRVKDFDALNTWHPGIAKDEIIEGRNNEVGAVRLLTTGNGDQLHEKLLGFDAAGMNFRYGIIDEGGMVSNYESTLKVEAVTATTSRVIWSGSFTPNAGAPPPAPGPDGKVMTPAELFEFIYQSGLDNLKKLAETK